MGIQSSRIWLSSKDHKEIYLNGKYHDKMYIGSTLVWEKDTYPDYVPFNICYNNANGKYYIIAIPRAFDYYKVYDREHNIWYATPDNKVVHLFEGDTIDGYFYYLCTLPKNARILNMYPSENGDAILMEGDYFLKYNISEGSLATVYYNENAVRNYIGSTLGNGFFAYIPQSQVSIGDIPVSEVGLYHVNGNGLTKCFGNKVIYTCTTPSGIEYTGNVYMYSSNSGPVISQYSCFINSKLYYAFAASINYNGEKFSQFIIVCFTPGEQTGTVLFNEMVENDDSAMNVYAVSSCENKMVIALGYGDLYYFIYDTETGKSAKIKVDDMGIYGLTKIFRGYEDYALFANKKYINETFRTTMFQAVNENGVLEYVSPQQHTTSTGWNGNGCIGKGGEFVGIQFYNPSGTDITLASFLWRCDAGGGTGEQLSKNNSEIFKGKRKTT